MEWIIKGKKLRFGSAPIEVEPTKFGVDTVFFRLDPSEKWDTLICKIQAGSFSRFEYNACCDYFTVIDDSGKFIIGKVIFELKGTRSGKEKYLGSIDGSGVFMTQHADTISPFNRSPMLPNTYNVEVKEVKNCSGKDCQEAAIRKPNGSIDVSYHFRIVESLKVFHYLPVSEEPIYVSYDLDSGKVVIR